ncbi:MAG TPA: hypothetical protein VMV10_23870 [Pirellulales bacterium]|nr:hypothetical protein [Pirellulales bacterium]
MWCTNCRQDVPGIASQPQDGAASNGPLTCIRCGLVLAAASENAETSAPITDSAAQFDEPSTDAALAGLPAAFDTWELEEQLRRVKRLTAAPEAAASREGASVAGWRIDPGQSSPTARDQDARVEGERRRDAASAGDAWLSFFAWSALAGGVAAFTCGSVLTGWSLLAERDDLWGIGLPTLIGGQLTLVVGLVLQLQAAWRSQAANAVSLESPARPNSSSAQTPHVRGASRQREA